MAKTAQADPSTQPKNITTKKPHRILLLLDASAPMGNMWEAQGTRYKLAAQFMTGLAEEMYRRNSNIEFSLRVYGHLFTPQMNVCNDTRREVAFSKENYGQLQARLQDIKPLGKGSVQYAFSEAMHGELADTANYTYSVIVVADTGKHCGLDNNIKSSVPMFRKYLLQFGGKRNRSFDSTFAADTTAFRSYYDYIIRQYDATTENGFAFKSNEPDTVIIQAWAPEGIERRDPDTAYGFPTIYNSSNLTNAFVYQQVEGKYEQVEEVFFNGSKSKTLKVLPGVYKVAYITNGREHAKEFEVDHEMVIHLKLK